MKTRDELIISYFKHTFTSIPMVLQKINKVSIAKCIANSKDIWYHIVKKRSKEYVRSKM